MTDSNEKKTDFIINTTSYRRNLCEYIKYSNCLMEAIETRKRRFGDDGMAGILGRHMDGMIAGICKDNDEIKIDNFRISDMDHELRKIRYGISQRLRKSSPGDLDNLVRKYFEKALKSGQKIDEMRIAIGRDAFYGKSLAEIMEQYNKINKGSNFNGTA